MLQCKVSKLATCKYSPFEGFADSKQSLFCRINRNRYCLPLFHCEVMKLSLHLTCKTGAPLHFLNWFTSSISCSTASAPPPMYPKVSHERSRLPGTSVAFFCPLLELWHLDSSLTRILISYSHQESIKWGSPWILLKYWDRHRRRNTPQQHSPMGWGW